VEALTLAQRILMTEVRTTPALTHPNIRFFALLTIGKYGTAEHLPVVEKFLADGTTCGVAQVGTPPRPTELQVRDAALAVLLRITGERAQDFGAQITRNPYPVFELPLVAFAEPADREQALLRWHQWRTEHADAP
jgi:hypothetical protein